MTFSKKLPTAICALAVSVAGFSVHADDNPAQAAARIALAKQLFELNKQEAADAATPSGNGAADNSAQAAARIALAKQLFELNEAAKQAPPSGNGAADNSAQAAARIALAKEMFQQNEQQSSSATTSNSGNTQSTVITRWDKATPATESSSEQPATAAKKAAPVQTASMSKPSPAAAQGGYIGQDLGMKPITAPPIPVSASKADQLHALLLQYESDQITPQEYHKQRAAILAQP